MEENNTPREDFTPVEATEDNMTLDSEPESKPWWKKIKIKWAIIAGAVIIAAAAVYSFKDLFVAASVNGHLISRLSVIRELEKGSGKQALDFLVTQVLIKDELDKNGITISDEELNKEIDKITKNVEAQGQTLAAMLVMQNITEKELRNQVTTQLRLEKLLADQIAVSDQEVDDYVKTNKVTFPKDSDPAQEKENIREQLRRDKFSQVANAWLSDLRTKAAITRYVDY